MRDDIECPYCESNQEINHDDGQGYAEDEIHQQECTECNKIFAFTTSIHFSYDAKKADCLNDSNHDFQKTITCPVEYTMMRCSMCGEERRPTKEEMIKILKNN